LEPYSSLEWLKVFRVPGDKPEAVFIGGGGNNHVGEGLVIITPKISGDLGKPIVDMKKGTSILNTSEIVDEYVGINTIVVPYAPCHAFLSLVM
jgi:hypothetical protein